MRVNVNFGFNFDTIVNVNDSGQGSLRQYILNSNALDNTGLAIVGQTAGRDVSVFMISDGLAHAGLRAGLANLLSGAGVAVITPVTALPAITAADTSVDGTTQTVNVGNTNAVVLGTGGTVGVDNLALSNVAGPEVEISGAWTLSERAPHPGRQRGRARPRDSRLRDRGRPGGRVVSTPFPTR